MSETMKRRYATHVPGCEPDEVVQLTSIEPNGMVYWIGDGGHFEYGAPDTEYMTDVQFLPDCPSNAAPWRPSADAVAEARRIAVAGVNQYGLCQSESQEIVDLLTPPPAEPEWEAPFPGQTWRTNQPHHQVLKFEAPVVAWDRQKGMCLVVPARADDGMQAGWQSVWISPDTVRAEWHRVDGPSGSEEVTP